MIVVPAVTVTDEGSKFFPEAAPWGMIICSLGLLLVVDVDVVEVEGWLEVVVI